MARVFYDEDADPLVLAMETVAVLGYGIQGRAQALTLRDSGIRVIIGNRPDRYRQLAEEDGFPVLEIGAAVGQGSLILVLLPDELQPQIFREQIGPSLAPGAGVVLAHGFAIRYRLIEPLLGTDLMLLAPRLPGQYLRQRYLEGWGVPAFVSVQQDGTGRALPRLLGLARALGITRCAAIELSADQETELDHFSEHFLYPLVFRTLEVAFQALVDAGYPPEASLMELYGSGELGQVLDAASREGLYGMIRSHASPVCQVGIAHYWHQAAGSEADVRRRIERVLDSIRDGRFARHVLEEQQHDYPELRRWTSTRSAVLIEGERRLRMILKGKPQRSAAIDLDPGR